METLQKTQTSGETEPSPSYRPLLQNFYGVTGPAPNDYPKVAARVSPEDHAFISRLFHGFYGKHEVIISTLYARFIAHLRTTLPDSSPLYDADDPRWATVFSALYSDVLPGCPTRRDFLLTKQAEARANVVRAASRVRQALLGLESLLADPGEGVEGGVGGETESEEEQRQHGGGVAEGIAELDTQTNDLFKLLKS